MQALFIGQTYIDVTFITDHMPTGDEKHVAKDYAVSFGGNAVTAAFCCAKLGIVPDLIATVANDWLGRMFQDMSAKYGISIHPRKVNSSSLSFIMPKDGKRAIVRCRDDEHIHPFPLLNLGGGNISLAGYDIPLATQDFNVYDGTGATATEVGNISTYQSVTNLLGLTNTEFTVETVTGTSADLPSVGSVYDVFNLGNGIENVYTAIADASGGAGTVTDTLVTPWGDLNLDSLLGDIDAASALGPGDAFTAGLDAASAAATTIDPLAFLGL